METVTMTLQRYDDMKFEHDYLVKQLFEYKKMGELFTKAKEMLLKQNLDRYNLNRFSVEELTDINNWRFALNNNQELLEIISLEEMVEFIKKEKEIYELERDDK